MRICSRVAPSVTADAAPPSSKRKAEGLYGQRFLFFVAKVYRRSYILSTKKRNRRKAVSLLEVSENLLLLIPPLEVLYVPTIAEKHQNNKKYSQDLRILKKRRMGAEIYLCDSGCFCLPLYFCVAAGTPFSISSETARTARSTASFIAGISSSVMLDRTQSARS